MLEVQIRYNSANHAVSVPGDASLALLMGEIAAKTKVPAERQKLILKGKPLSEPDSPLATLNVMNGTRLLLLEKDANPSDTTPHPRRTDRYRPNISDSMEFEPHKSVIQKGPPPDIIKSLQGQTSALPSEPFSVYATDGTPSRLAVESDALFIRGNNGSVERIFFSDVLGAVAIPLPGDNSGYFALGFQSNVGVKWFYFLPNQYKQFFMSLFKKI